MQGPSHLQHQGEDHGTACAASPAGLGKPYEERNSIERGRRREGIKRRMLTLIIRIQHQLPSFFSSSIILDCLQHTFSPPTLSI
jgi:hypothetical protein